MLSVYPKADSKHFQECETKATTSCRHCINEEKDMVGSESKYCISENKKIHPRANEIKNGLYIESISMRNSTTGRTIWTSKYLVGKDLFAKEFEGKNTYKYEDMMIHNIKITTLLNNSQIHSQKISQKMF